MKNLSAHTESLLAKYRSCKELFQEAKEKDNSKSCKRKIPPELFHEKFLAITAQIESYRNLLSSLMSKARIEVYIQRPETRLGRTAVRVVQNSLLDKNSLIFAILNGEDLFFNKITCNFLAFCGDPDTSHIHVYEYSEPLLSTDIKSLIMRRNAFKEHAQHLTLDHIDKFDFEEIIPYIERYVEKQLDFMLACVGHPKRETFDYWLYYRAFLDPYKLFGKST
ncbi:MULTISPECIES: hypothetical protein [Sphingobacterium]|uniref:hypothetical protein n=1 Tax=Sphingobacterium TaxID=28453 RepID=UPI0013DB32F0|nr:MULTISPECIES: hypothetical protein [unclassified Sphingobacterium]